MDDQHVNPYGGPARAEVAEGAEPPKGAFDTLHWMPVVWKLLAVFKTGKGWFSTTVPGFGKRYCIVTDKRPSEDF